MLTTRVRLLTAMYSSTGIKRANLCGKTFVWNFVIPCSFVFPQLVQSHELRDSRFTFHMIFLPSSSGGIFSLRPLLQSLESESTWNQLHRYIVTEVFLIDLATSINVWNSLITKLQFRFEWNRSDLNWSYWVMLSISILLYEERFHWKL